MYAYGKSEEGGGTIRKNLLLRREEQFIGVQVGQLAVFVPTGSLYRRTYRAFVPLEGSLNKTISPAAGAAADDDDDDDDDFVGVSALRLLPFVPSSS